MPTLNLHTTANLDNLIPEHWEKKIRDDAAKKAFWDKFEGAEGSNQPIIVRNDFTKQAGDLVHINVVSELYNDGVTGESTLKGSEGKLSIGQFNLTVDWLRNAIAFNKRATKRALFDAIMVSNRRLSDWLARRKDEDMFTQLLDTATPDTLYANDATSSATLGTNDTFGTTEIDRIRLALMRKGAIPISTVTKGKGEFPVYAIVISEVDAYNLKADAVWVDAQANANIRGEDNPLFSGAFGMYGGVLIYVHHGISGFQGSPLRPEASIYGAHANDVTTITVGADTTKNYTKFFPSSGTIQINKAGAFEYVSYTGKTNNTFTTCTRGATYGGTAKDGATTYAGSELVTLYNHRARQVGFGAEIAARVWGQQPQRITQTEDYGFEYGIGIEAIYGQKAIEDSAAKKPNYLIMESYAANPSATI
jgi:N4-gp56 family major capsid protein